VAAIGFAVAGVAGAGSAHAGAPASPPDYQYSSIVGAIGAQVALQAKPDFSSVPDMFDVQTPNSDAQLDSFGTSQADGHVSNLNGLGQFPALICLAAGENNCAAIPIGQLTGGLITAFPPPDPLDAHATYPQQPTGAAPLIGTKSAQLEVNSSGFKLAAGAANATAAQYATSTYAADQDLGLTGAFRIGSAVTTTSQAATSTALTTTATADISDVDFGSGKILHIGNIHVTTTVVSAPGKKPSDTTVTTVSGVTAAGLAASIDNTGIHIKQVPGVPPSLIQQIQDAVNATFGQGGIHFAVAPRTVTNDVNGNSVTAGGLIITYDHTVSGAPPITVAPPQGVPCPVHTPPQYSLPDPCSGLSFNLNAAYHGQITLGEVAVVSRAQPSFAVSPGVTPPGGRPGGSPAGPTTNPSIPNPPVGGQTLTGTQQGGGPPTIAPTQQQLADQLAGTSHRVLWFFPLFAVGVFALVGRLRTPARLPKA
jgi:hypothetical protein